MAAHPGSDTTLVVYGSATFPYSCGVFIGFFMGFTATCQKGRVTDLKNESTGTEQALCSTFLPAFLFLFLTPSLGHPCNSAQILPSRFSETT